MEGGGWGREGAGSGGWVRVDFILDAVRARCVCLREKRGWVAGVRLLERWEAIGCFCCSDTVHAEWIWLGEGVRGGRGAEGEDGAVCRLWCLRFVYRMLPLVRRRFDLVLDTVRAKWVCLREGGTWYVFCDFGACASYFGVWLLASARRRRFW